MKNEKEIIKMSDNIFDSLRAEFLSESNERIDHIEEIMLGLSGVPLEQRQEKIAEAKREMHTLKGNSGMMGFKDVQQLCHELEDKTVLIDAGQLNVEDILKGLDRCRILFKSVSSADEQPLAQISLGSAGQEIETGSELIQESIRVPFVSLDDLVNLLAEIIIQRNRLKEVLQHIRSKEATNEDWEEAKIAEEDLTRTIGFLYTRILRLRMVPLRDLFRQMKRLVYDESSKEGKQIEFLSDGGDTPVDKALLEVANEALGHIIRNAVIHGIELPEEREHFGKSRIGHIQLSAQMVANEVIIDIEDDGKGINKQSVLDHAAQQGVELPPGDNPYSILFVSGFSTKKSADLSAGRGIGLSAVREAVRRMGGQIEIESEEGIGTRFRLKLPLNVSIIRALMVKADNEEYALPLNAIVANMKLMPGDLHEMNKSYVYKWREEIIPIVDIGYIFDTASEPRKKGYLTIIESAGKNRGLLVDEIIGIQEIVVKGLDPLIGTPHGIAGSTILGNGQAILILDPTSLVLVSPFIENIS